MGIEHNGFFAVPIAVNSHTVSESKASQPGHLDSHVKQNELNAEGQFTCHIDPRDHAKLVKIIVHKCTVPGLLNGTDDSLLWDTGAQVSLISEEQLQNIPDAKIEDLSTLLQADLHLTAANGSEIPFTGWTKLCFQLEENGKTLMVPFLVTNTGLELPILCYNVIPELAKISDSNPVAKTLCPRASPQGLAIIARILQRDPGEDLCLLSTCKREQTIPAGQVKNFSVHARIGQVHQHIAVLFEPEENPSLPSELSLSETLCSLKPGKSRSSIQIANNSSHDVTLQGRTLLGRVSLVRSITPVQIGHKENSIGWAL